MPAKIRPGDDEDDDEEEEEEEGAAEGGPDRKGRSNRIIK